MIEFSKYIKEESVAGNIISIVLGCLFKIIRIKMLLSGDTNSKVVIISLNKLGDTVFTIPAVKTIRSYYDEPPIIVCYAESKLVYQLVFDDLQYVILKNDDFYFNGRISKTINREIVNELRAGIIIDLTCSIKSASIIFNSTAKEIIGSNDKYFSALYTKYIPARKLPNLVDKYLDIANKKCNAFHEIESNEYEDENNNDGYILIHPFAGWKAKEWGFNKFIEVTQRLSSNYKCKLIIPAKLFNEAMAEKLNTLRISYIITYKLEKLIEAIKGCSAIIGNDSGAIYIASILGKATFTIYGPTNPSYSLPNGDRHAFVKKQIKCSPEVNKQYCNKDAGRRCSYFECMELLPVHEVMHKVDLFLSSVNVPRNVSNKLIVNIED